MLLLAAFVAAALAPAPAVAQQMKKRVAVLVFEDKSDGQMQWYNRRIHAGEGVSDMLTTALVNSGQYIVLERQEMDEILREQDLVQQGVVTPESAARIGQMLGVELAVMGAVTEFGYKASDVGGATRRLGVGVESQAAVVAVDVRLVDTSTGEIIAADDVRKQESKRGLRLRTEDFSFANRNEFDQSLVGKATRDAIESIVKLIDDHADELTWSAKVVTVAGDAVIINAGEKGGVSVGDRFVIYRPGEELIDPDTGLSLGSMESRIGEIEVVKNDIGEGKASQCKIVSGQGMERGDLVRIED